MKASIVGDFSEKFFVEIEKLLPGFRKDPVDFGINGGNVAVFVFGPDGEIFGKTFGADKPKCRDTATTAWKKASQVWLTRIATGEYERKVYNGEVNWFSFGIMKPDLIGWEGGIPGILPDKTEVSLGFSGFRGEKDAEILEKALVAVGGKRT
jgi:uncharacterized protein GlcG (DUF336 family)